MAGILQVLFNALPTLSFVQGEMLPVNVTIADASSALPINLTGAIVGINFPLQGGGAVKRTTGPVGVASSAIIQPQGGPPPPAYIQLNDHGFVTGDPIQVAAQMGGTLPAPLAALTNYQIQVINVNQFYITDTSQNIITLTNSGTVGFNITNSNDVQIVTGDLGQVTLNLRTPVTKAINALLSQDFEVFYVLGGLTRIAYLAAQLDVLNQPVQ